MIATALSLASSIGLIWGVLEVFTEFQRNSAGGPVAAAKRVAARYGF